MMDMQCPVFPWVSVVIEWHRVWIIAFYLYSVVLKYSCMRVRWVFDWCGLGCSTSHYPPSRHGHHRMAGPSPAGSGWTRWLAPTWSEKSPTSTGQYHHNPFQPTLTTAGVASACHCEITTDRLLFLILSVNVLGMFETTFRKCYFIVFVFLLFVFIFC